MSVNYLDNLLVNGALSASGSLSASNFFGNGSNLTNLTISIPSSANWNTSYSWLTSNSANATFTNSVSAPSISANNLFVNSINSQGAVNMPSTTIIQNTSSTGNALPFVIAASSNLSVYNQIQNLYGGLSASTDFVLTNNTSPNSYNNAANLGSYLDIGINSSAYNGNAYSPAFNVVGPNDSYMYSIGGNLAIGTSTNNNLVFFTGGTLSANAAMVITSTGAVSASNFIGNGANLTGIVASNGVCLQSNNCFIGGGFNNSLCGTDSVVVGGANNKACAWLASVLGGSNNTASGYASVAVGGQNNCSSNGFTFVGGGFSNSATGNRSAILAGQCNTASGNYSNIGGGCCNTVIFNNSNINGGVGNTMSCYVNGGGGVALASTNTINGGCTNFIGLSTCGNGASYLYNNVIDGGSSNCITAISNGSQHIATTCNSFIGGGTGNCLAGINSSVLGGSTNTLSANCAFIAGGTNNVSCGFDNTFILGSNLTASRSNTTYVNNLSSQGYIYGNGSNLTGIYGVCQSGTNFIGGGSGNTATGTNVTVAGGCGNSASGNYTTVIGGKGNVACGGNYAIAGGCGSCACGSISIALGLINTATAQGSVTIGGQQNCNCGCYSAILGGIGNNTNNQSCVFIFGQSIVAPQPNFTYVNNLSTNGSICGTYYGNGSGLNNVTSINGVCQSGTNFIGGGSGNTASGAYSITIGGKTNANQGVQSLIASGSANNICTSNGPVYLSDIIGGQCNTISGYSLVYQSTILNGCCNIIYPWITGGGGGKIYNSTILNGSRNSFATCNYPSVLCSSFIGVGDCNCIIGYGSSCYNFIGSGIRNSIGTNSGYCTTQSSFIISGSGNCIYNSGFNGILGGCGNILNACNSFIIGSNINGSQQGYTYVNNLSSQGAVAGASVSAVNFFGTGNQVILSDGYTLNNVNGNGASTLSMNFANGVYVGLSGSNPIYALGVPQYVTLQSTASSINSGMPYFYNGFPQADYLTSAAQYEIEYVLYYQKNTAGTVTYQLSSANTIAFISSNYIQTAVGGITPNGATSNAAALSAFSNGVSLPATGSLTAGASANAIIKAYFQTSVSATNLVLNIIDSAGNITPLQGSYRKVTRIS